MRKTLLAHVGALVVCCALNGPAQVAEMLHETQDGTRDNYEGVIGNTFKVGSSNVVVSHLGVYDNNSDGLVLDHHAGIFNADGSAIVGQVTVPLGGMAYLTNGFRWMPLDPPLLLNANTIYVLAADVFNGSGDPWKDSFTPTNWNARFVGTNTTASSSRYSAGGTAWPAFPSGGFGTGTAYGNVNLGYIEIDKARAGVASTSVSTSAGQPLTLVGFASGAPGITYQWWKAPATPLPGRTTPSFTISSASVSDSGTYYLTASNSIGGSKSADITVTVTAFPVGIQSGPTNISVLANYAATFSAIVTGSPPISLQWLRNGTPIPGANSNTYSFTATSANNGEEYSIAASNNVSGTPHTIVSSSAALTVLPNLGQPEQMLHGARAGLTTNNYAGCVGGIFTTANRETLVTHLGYYATRYTDATHAELSDDHTIYIFNADYTTNASVVVTAGTSLPVVNGYIWAALNPPVTLAANTSYILGADTSLNDPWGNTYVVPDWSSYYTDPSKASTFAARYNNPGKAPYYGNYSGQMYSAPNMAILPLGEPTASVTPATVTEYEKFPVTLYGLVNGQAPITGQWFKGTPPSGTAVPGKTNINFVLQNPSPSDSGDYYLEVRNSLGVSQSAASTVTILPSAGPNIVTDPQSQSVLVYSTVKFSVTAQGTPPMSYQWSFKGEPIPGATNSIYTLRNASAASQGTYSVLVTNLYGSDSGSATFTVIAAPPAGTYPAAVMQPSLIAYYRLSDVSTGVATNMGSLGFAYNGAYRGFAETTTGPVNMSNFGSDNPALQLDGSTADVELPPFDVTLTNATIAAWVYSGGGQENDDAIYYHRGSGVLGLSVFPDTNSVKYTWAGANYNFQTGLTLPNNQWALVVMSVTPSRASVYVRDESGLRGATNVANHPAQNFNNTSYIGWDSAGGLTGRRWTGGIDELMIFDRALSASEVENLYLGLPIPGSVMLTIARSGPDSITLTWPAGTLQEATDLNGTWSSLPTASSPYTVQQSGARKFYRVQVAP